MRWEQRLRPVRRRLEDVSLGGLLSLVAAGDEDAHSELCWRYSNRVRTRLARRFRSPHELDAAVRQTFGRLFDLIAADRARSHSFDELLTTLADSVALDGRIRHQSHDMRVRNR